MLKSQLWLCLVEVVFAGGYFSSGLCQSMKPSNVKLVSTRYDVSSQHMQHETLPLVCHVHNRKLELNGYTEVHVWNKHFQHTLFTLLFWYRCTYWVGFLFWGFHLASVQLNSLFTVSQQLGLSCCCIQKAFNLSFVFLSCLACRVLPSYEYSLLRVITLLLGGGGILADGCTLRAFVTRLLQHQGCWCTGRSRWGIRASPLVDFFACLPCASLINFAST